MQSLHTPSDLSVMFDDDHAVANAGLALVGLLSEKLGLEQLCDDTISISSFPGRSVATLAHSLVIGGPTSTTPTCCVRVRPRRFLPTE